MECCGKHTKGIFVTIAFMAVLALSLFAMAAIPHSADAATRYGSAKVTKTVGKAYSKFLRTHNYGYFTVKDLGGKTKALIVSPSNCVYEVIPGSGDKKYSRIIIYLYKSGKVKKLGAFNTGCSYNFTYGKRALLFHHNSIPPRVLTIRSGKLCNQSFTYSSSADYASAYFLNGKKKLTGDRANDKLNALKRKYGTKGYAGEYRLFGKTELSMSSNTAAKRLKVLGFE